MNTTVHTESKPDLTFEIVRSASSDGLGTCYQAIIRDRKLGWFSNYAALRPIGQGGQGVVFVSDHTGADGFQIPVALKVFSPDPYKDSLDYEADMVRIAGIATRVAQIQHDHLLDVHDFVEQQGIRIMVMEWVDGFDLSRLLDRETADQVRGRVSAEQWQHISDVIVAPGPAHGRLKPGIAIQVVQECLTGLAALHRAGVVHGDLKPSNIMLKRTGNAKIIDIGSAVDLEMGSRRRAWTPTYAAPEVLRGSPNSPQTDLASLGYVLVEMLSGQPPFSLPTTPRDLLEAKQTFGQRLAEILPPDVVGNTLLLNLCRRLTEADPARRIQSAEEANLDREGAAEFHRQLVQGGLASVYENDIRVWLGYL